MNTHRTFLAVGSAIVTLVIPAAAQAPKMGWELSKGIKAPESAYFDKETGMMHDQRSEEAH